MRLEEERQMGENADPIFEIGTTNPLGIMELEEVASLLGKKTQTIRNWVAKREIPFVKLGNRAVVLRDSLRQWLLDKERKPNGSC
jgi:excisionase family DNA binding protein